MSRRMPASTTSGRTRAGHGRVTLVLVSAVATLVAVLANGSPASAMSPRQVSARPQLVATVPGSSDRPAIPAVTPNDSTTSAGVDTPVAQQRTAAYLTLSATTSGGGDIDYQYRMGADGAFTEIPASDVTYQGTTAHPVWPIPPHGSIPPRGGLYLPLTWNLAKTVTDAGGNDGLVEVVSCAYLPNSPIVCSNPPTEVQFNRHAFGTSLAATQIGPGTVSSVTGDFRLAATDASATTAYGSLAVGRVMTTLDPTGEDRNLLPATLHDAETDLSGFVPENATVTAASSPTTWGADSLSVAPNTGPGSSDNTAASVGGDEGALRLGLVPGQDYTFTTHEYVPSTTGLTPDYAARGERPVAFTRVGTGAYVETDGSAPTVTGGWQTVSVTFLVPVGATEAFIRLYNGFAQGKVNDAVYYDDSTLAQNTGFGPGWVADLPGAGGAAADSLTDDTSTNGTAMLTSPDGSQLVYVAAGSTYPISYTPVADANDGSTLVKNDASTFVLTEQDGTETTWKTVGTNALWRTSSVTAVGSLVTNYLYNASGNLVTIVGAPPAGVSCTTAPTTTPGCRSLVINYATATTATGLGQTQWGNYAGNFSSVALVATNPSSPTVMTSQTLATYLYDTTGHLRAAYDPRISPILETTYSYDQNGRIASLGSPGVNPWSFAYDSTGRLTSTSRADPGRGGTDTTTVVYNVPLTGGSNGLPFPNGPTYTAVWGGEQPVAAVAIFPPGYPVNVGYDADGNPVLASGDWPWASLTYMDVSGRPIYQSTYGAGAWQTSMEVFDTDGHMVFSADALALDEVLNPLQYGMDSYARALQVNDGSPSALAALGTIYKYDGSDLTEVDGPYHVALVGDYTSSSDPQQLDPQDEDLHARTRYTYDENSPNGATYHLPTTVTKDAVDQDGEAFDPLVTKLGYNAIEAGDPSGWSLRKPTTSTVVMDSTSPNLTTTTRYNAQGQTIELRAASDPTGVTARTSLTAYYTATGTGPCVNIAEAGLACRTSPAAQPTSGPKLPTNTVTYSILNQPLTTTSANGTTTRKSTNTYDTAGRAITSAVTVTPAANGGTPVPKTTISYSPTMGLPATESASGGATITTGYDTDGRVYSYHDGTELSSDTVYDADGRVSIQSDGMATTTYTYDTSTEHRSLVTSKSDNIAGTFTATYDPDGRMVTQTYPNGLVATHNYGHGGIVDYDSLIYTVGTSTWASSVDVYNDHGQVAVTAGSPGQFNEYDDAQRLVVAYNATSITPTCPDRMYLYDADADRTGIECEGVNTTSFNYDQADRLTGSGYTYDDLGRTTTVPSSGLAPDTDLPAASGSVTLTYYANDMVSSESRQGSTSNVDRMTIDPAGRLATQYDGVTGTTETNDYANSSDSPAWTESFYDDGTTSIQHDVVGIDGNLAAESSTYAGTWSTTLELTDLQSNVIAQTPNNPTFGVESQSSYTEFGTNGNGNPNATYGWKGGKQRSADGFGGLVEMGARLYDPTLGRFLQPDSVPGGSCNPYDYACQDPLNKSDLSGTLSMDPNCYLGCDPDCHQSFCDDVGYDQWVFDQMNSSHPDCADDYFCVMAVDTPWKISVTAVNGLHGKPIMVLAPIHYLDVISQEQIAYLQSTDVSMLDLATDIGACYVGATAMAPYGAAAGVMAGGVGAGPGAVVGAVSGCILGLMGAEVPEYYGAEYEHGGG